MSDNTPEWVKEIETEFVKYFEENDQYWKRERTQRLLSALRCAMEALESLQTESDFFNVPDSLEIAREALEKIRKGEFE